MCTTNRIGDDDTYGEYVQVIQKDFGRASFMFRSLSLSLALFPLSLCSACRERVLLLLFLMEVIVLEHWT